MVAERPLFNGRENRPLYRLHLLLDRLANSRWLQPILIRRYEREFLANEGSNLFRGVFDSAEAAMASLPQGYVAGYDNEESAELYEHRTLRAYPADYPVMFWLQRLLDSGVDRILDVGGHIGVSYFAYQAQMRLPAGLRWTVLDLPAVVARGRLFASKHDSLGQLDFCETYAKAGAPQLVLASGSAQYLPQPLVESLVGMTPPPVHVLINLVPIHMSKHFFTLQSIGTAFCAYQVFQMEAFVEHFAAHGYRLVDWWENPEKSCIVPFHPGHSLDRYYGFLFKRESIPDGYCPITAGLNDENENPLAAGNTSCYL